MHKIKLTLILSCLFSNLLFADENKNVNISGAWINEAPPTVSVLAAYATIQNLSDKEQTLTAITSSSFSKIELHLSKVVNGMAKMEKQNSLLIPANNTVKLSPGTYHLMLFNPESPLIAGDMATLTFNFADGTSNIIKAIVKKRNAGGHEHDHEHHHHDQ